MLFVKMSPRSRKESEMSRTVNTALATALVVAAFTGAAWAEQPSVDSLPPSVVKTVPTCGDTEVPVNTSEIKVTFSKDMMTKQMWSWCMQSQDTFPEITDQKGIKYLADNRTCVLPVKLQPGKTYVIWINTQQNNAFRDASGKPAVPYLLVFKTK